MNLKQKVGVGLAFLGAGIVTLSLYGCGRAAIPFGRIKAKTELSQEVISDYNQEIGYSAIGATTGITALFLGMGIVRKEL